MIVGNARRQWTCSDRMERPTPCGHLRAAGVLPVLGLSGRREPIGHIADVKPRFVVTVMSCAPAVSAGEIATNRGAGLDHEASRHHTTAVRDRIRRGMERFAIASQVVARAIASAIKQPRDVEIGDITIRPTVRA